MQIHKATADYLGKKQDKKGFYQAQASQLINLHEHTAILMQLQSDIKTNHEKHLDFLRDEVRKYYNSYRELQNEKEGKPKDWGKEYKVEQI